MVLVSLASYCKVLYNHIWSFLVFYCMNDLVCSYTVLKRVLWSCIILCDLVWYNRVYYGKTYPLMVLKGLGWSCMAMYGVVVWSFMAFYGIEGSYETKQRCCAFYQKKCLLNQYCLNECCKPLPPSYFCEHRLHAESKLVKLCRRWVFKKIPFLCPHTQIKSTRSSNIGPGPAENQSLAS